MNLVTGGGDVGSAVVVSDTVRVVSFTGSTDVQDEISGPVVSVIPCRSFEEAVGIGNGVQYGLSASIYTQDVNRAFTAMRDIDTGIF